jgi:pimeloyl-ACP methyl ester carboxylesterase
VVSRTAPAILAAVQKVLQATGTTKVTLVGHSLGAAIALLDSVYLPLHLPAGTTFTTSVFGLPRVGNLAFADYGMSDIVRAQRHRGCVDMFDDPPEIKQWTQT